MGPPSQGAAAVHTTPIAVPISVTIGEPDISLRMPSAAWVIHSGPPKWRTVQENHRRPSSDSSRAGTQKLTGCRRVPPIESDVRFHQRFVFIGVWTVGRTEYRDVGDRIDKATHRPRPGIVPEGGEERSVGGALLGPEKGLGRREER